MEERFLYQPVKPWRPSQHFGENRACIALDGSNRVISCNGNNPPKGYRSLYGAKGHNGIDVPTYRGQEVYAPCDGKVVEIDTDPRTGLDIRVEVKVGKRKFRYICEHLLGYQPPVKADVKRGDLLGWADNTGYSSRDHLHFQLDEFVNGVWEPRDPAEYMHDIFVQDQLFRESLIRWIKEFIASRSDNLAYWLRGGTLATKKNNRNHA